MPERPIIIKRADDEAHDGHHGGAWKVAYADFMTAMMAFFLLLWILAASDEEKLRGLADYFTPSLSEAGGRGQGLLAGQVLAEDGTLSGTDGPYTPEQLPSFGQENPLAVFDSRLRNEIEIAAPQPGEGALVGSGLGEGGEPATAEAAEREQSEREATNDSGESGESDSTTRQTLADLAIAEAERRERLEALRERIEQAVAADPELAELQGQIRFELSNEGLEIQLVDSDRRPMFAVGSAELDVRVRQLVGIVGRAIAPIDKPVAIAGHTDSLSFGEGAVYTNWELSTDRANATRRALQAEGVVSERFERISGMADSDPLDASRPDAPENRRIDILLVYPADFGVPAGSFSAN